MGWGGHILAYEYIYALIVFPLDDLIRKMGGTHICISNLGASLCENYPMYQRKAVGAPWGCKFGAVLHVDGYVGFAQPCGA